MPQFGVVAPPPHAAAIAAAGFDYLEGQAQPWFQGGLSDAEYAGVEAYRAGCPLAIPAVASFLPGALKIVGPDVDAAAVEVYLSRTLRRAGAAGVENVVFGSGQARRRPDNFGEAATRQQLVDFCRLAGRLARDAGVVVVVEPLQSGETNTLNTLADAAELVADADAPALRLLVDSYHLWEEDEPVAHVAANVGMIEHVHVADVGTRAVPGDDPSQGGRYREFFAALKHGGYDGRVSVEARTDFAEESLRRSLAFLREQWDAA